MALFDKMKDSISVASQGGIPESEKCNREYET